MLCKTSTIRHPSSDFELDTPILIPSFSSKGFTSPGPNGASDLSKLFASASEFLTDPYLVSAYDIFHGYLPPSSEFYHKPEVVFVDSGGYEASVHSGYSEVFRSSHNPRPWTLTDLRSVLASWPEGLPAAFVSFDHPKERKPFEDQVADAKRLFQEHWNHLRVLLLKPETRTQMTLGTVIRSAVAKVEELDRFDIIGLTEKELGRTMLDRMSSIAKLRLAMDDAAIRTPLHIFGALDPLTVCLYYVSGAEVFDGLSWLRYGYHNGLCVYTHNVGAIVHGLHVFDDDVRIRTLKNNLYVLQDLKHRLATFEVTEDYDKLAPHGEFVLGAFDLLKTKFRGRL